jgi:uncharacterized membrane protein
MGCMEAKGSAIVMIGHIPMAVGPDPGTVLLIMLTMLAIVLIWATLFRGW